MAMARGGIKSLKSEAYAVAPYDVEAPTQYLRRYFPMQSSASLSVELDCIDSVTTP